MGRLKRYVLDETEYPYPERHKSVKLNNSRYVLLPQKVLEAVEMLGDQWDIRVVKDADGKRYILIEAVKEKEGE